VLVNRAKVALAQVLVALHRVDEARPMAEEIIAFSTPRGDRRSEHFGCITPPIARSSRGTAR